jgi:hypothetical protein
MEDMVNWRMDKLMLTYWNMLRLAAILSLPIFHGCKSSFDCSLYKTGKFSYLSKETTHRILIIREDSTQLEEDVDGNASIREKIIWINPCQYDIVEIRKITDTSEVKLNAPNPIHTTIANGQGDSYTVEIEYRDKKNRKVISDLTVKVLKFGNK